MLGQGYILARIKKYNTRLIIWCVFFFLIALAFASGLPNYYYNLDNGPFKMSFEELDSLENADSLEENYVTIEGDKVYELIQDDGFLLLDVGGYYLPVKGDLDNDGLSFTGKLSTLSDTDSESIYSALDKQDVDMDSLKGTFYPVILDTSDYAGSKSFEFVLIAIMLLLVLFNVYKFVKRTSSPISHPLCKALSAYGDIEAVAGRIDREIEKDYGDTAKKYPTMATETWFIRRGAFSLKFIPLSDVIWAYQKVTTQRVYGVIPAGKTYQLVICTRNKDKFEFSGVKDHVINILDKIAENAPWAVTGYSEKLADLWKKQKDEFIKEVEIRKDQARQFGAASVNM